jgi:hypothetical protein
MQDHTEEQSYWEFQEQLRADPGYLEWLNSITATNLRKFYESQRHVPFAVSSQRGLSDPDCFDGQARFDGDGSEG